MVMMPQARRSLELLKLDMWKGNYVRCGSLEIEP